MARKTKSPKKLKVERDGEKFKCSWKNGEVYDEGLRVSDYIWSSFGIPINTLNKKNEKTKGSIERDVYNLGKTAESKVFRIDFDNYHPKTLGIFLLGFCFGVEGNRKKFKEKNKTIDPGWSEKVLSEYFDIEPPKQMKKPVLSLTEPQRCSVSYTLPADTQHNPYVDIEWYSCLTKGGEKPDWDNPDRTGVRSIKAATSFALAAEDEYKGQQIDWTVEGYSYTRWIRFRARGPGGYGKWSDVAKHVYTRALVSKNVTASIAKSNKSAGYLCKVMWTSDTDKTRPNDSNILQYKFAIPTEDMECPEDDDWTDVVTMSDTKKTDSYSFVVQALPPLNHVMFVRVNTLHDGVETYGYPVYVEGSAAKLSAPVLGSISLDETTYKVELGITNVAAEADVEGAMVGIYYRDGSDKTGDGSFIGITTGDPQTDTYQLPEWGKNGFAIGLKTYLGADFEASTQTSTIKVDEPIAKIIPESDTLTFDTEFTPVSSPNATTISFNYTWTVPSPGISNSFSFVAGSSQTIQRDGLLVEYDGVKSFEVSHYNSSGEVVVDTISYTHTVDPTFVPTYYSKKPSTDSPIGIMESDFVWGGDIPLPPSTVHVEQNGVNTILVTWDWNWKEANTAEISWSMNEDAWESTDEPQTYNVSNIRASRWKLANLEPGKWYVKVRLIKSTDETVVYGTYANADVFPLKVSSAPTTPSITLLPDTITLDGSTTASWAYEAEDGTTQSAAEVFEAVPTGRHDDDPESTPLYNYVALNPRATATSAQFITIYPREQGWQEGETHQLCVRVESTANELSEGYSDPKPVTIVTKPVVDVVGTNLSNNVTREIDSYTHETETRDNVLTNLPLRINVAGAGSGGMSYVSILRDGASHGERPDGTDYDGFDNEVVASKFQNGDGWFEFDVDDFLKSGGYLDDNDYYKIRVTVKDAYGQMDSTETPGPAIVDEATDDGGEDDEGETVEIENETRDIKFVVWWEHQAVIPAADFTPPQDVPEEHDDAVFITPYIPERDEDLNPERPVNWTADTDDRCNIYRLSADGPQLIVEKAEFGETYVDPYPTLGRFGGYRIVFITKNGDCSTGSRDAVADYGDGDEGATIDKFAAIINFGRDNIVLPYDITVSHKWTKDVTITKYLDGSITADWNKAVEMTSSVNSTVIILEDPEQIEALRRLANYPGYCHVRTPDGSSFTADVQVNEDHEEKWVPRLAKFSLSITRVDGPFYDGMTYDEWLQTVEP